MTSIKAEILRLHELSIIRYGGAKGIRDENLLESAVGRPFQTFDGNDLYLDIYEKSASIGESIIINHPFLDGNKRTGLLAMAYLLNLEKIVFDNTNQNQLYEFIINISVGKLKFDDIVIWLKNNTILLK